MIKYRLFQHEDKNGNLSYSIHEVYYDGEDILGYSKLPVFLIGDKKGRLKKQLKKIKNAFKKPIFLAQDFPNKVIYLPEIKKPSV